MPHAYSIKVNFYDDWITRLKEQLLVMNYEPAISPQDICFQYFNLHRRFVPSIPRQVLFSNEFTCPKDLENGLKVVKEKIEKGVDLKPHLSKKILDINYHDDLLNDWGIHHLHLGTEMEKSGFAKRTGPVLFVRFEEKRAYFIDVMKHGDWAKQKMVQILHNNWPESIEKFRINEAQEVAPKLTDQHIKQLRKAHAIAFVQAKKGAVYAPIGMGYATSGHSIEVVRTCDFYAQRLRQYENHLRENIGSLVKELKGHGISLGNKLHFLLGIEQKDLYAFEVYSRVFIKLGPLH